MCRVRGDEKSLQMDRHIDWLAQIGTCTPRQPSQRPIGRSKSRVDECRIAARWPEKIASPLIVFIIYSIVRMVRTNHSQNISAIVANTH
jgi:hypothetical protein